jgi:transporter family-2 protein
MPVIAFLVVLLAGVGLAVQPPTNAMLARMSGSVLLAALISFFVGTVMLAGAWLATDRTSPTTLHGAPAWAWLGGLYGAVFVAAMAYAAPRLGLATTLTVAIASQLATALVLDHFGLLGLKAIPVSPGRIVGVAIVLVGIVLVRRS